MSTQETLKTVEGKLVNIMAALPARPSRLKLTDQLSSVLTDVQVVLGSMQSEQERTVESFSTQS